MNEGKKFVEAMEASAPQEPRKGGVVVEAKEACDCGCGAPLRCDITILGYPPVSLVDPRTVDRMVDRLKAAREKLWGPRPPEGE
ncbi:MAG: hypothetical protein U0790_25150 [Isosphaeraceae bacterium]